MSDIKTENLLHVREAALLLPRSPISGNRLRIETIKRWSRDGVCGGTIKLEVVRLPGGVYTSTQALTRFLDRVDAARSAPRRAVGT